MSASLERQVAAYLDPKQYALFKGFCTKEGMGNSEALKLIIKAFFNDMPEDLQKQYLEKARSSNN